MTLFQILLFVHILAAMVWIGGALVGTVIGSFLRRTGDTHVMSEYCRAFATIAGPAFGGSGMIVLITGLWMVGDGYPAFSDLWVSIGLGGWVVSLILGAVFAGGAWTKLGKSLAEEGASIDGLSGQFRTALRWTYLDLALRVAIVLVMVWRPT